MLLLLAGLFLFFPCSLHFFVVSFCSWAGDIGLSRVHHLLRCSALPPSASSLPQGVSCAGCRDGEEQTLVLETLFVAWL